MYTQSNDGGHHHPIQSKKKKTNKKNFPLNLVIKMSGGNKLIESYFILFRIKHCLHCMRLCGFYFDENSYAFNVLFNDV